MVEHNWVWNKPLTYISITFDTTFTQIGKMAFCNIFLKSLIFIQSVNSGKRNISVNEMLGFLQFFLRCKEDKILLLMLFRVEIVFFSFLVCSWKLHAQKRFHADREYLNLKCICNITSLNMVLILFLKKLI